MPLSALDIKFSPAARREIKKLSRNVQMKVLDAAEGLGACPRPPGVEKIKGRPEFLRIAIGDHRVIYTIASARLLVILVIRDRKDAYKGLSDLDKKLAAAVIEIAVTEDGLRLLAG